MTITWNYKKYLSFYKKEEGSLVSLMKANKKWVKKKNKS